MRMKTKKFAIAISIFVCAIMVIGSFVFDSSAEEINETNPELTFVEIDSDAEQVVNKKEIYKQDSTFSQDNGTYTIKTNSYVAWVYEDDIAYAYKNYPVCENLGDYMEATVTLNSEPSSTGTRHQNASAGLMFRSGTANNAAEVFIHVRGTSILAVYRSKAGDNTYVQYTNKTVKFPVELKMRKELNQVTLSWKSSGQDWQDFRYPIAFTTGGPLYVGLAGHSCDQATHLIANFSNLTIQGLGTYDGSMDSGNEPEIKEEYVEEDSPAASNVMLRETFSDGDLTNEPETNTNPIWPKPSELTILNLDGNRVWDRTFVDQNDWVGPWDEEDWTNDYDVSVDIQFTEKCNPDPASASNIFRLYARHTGIEFYGHTHYAAVVSEGYKISLYKASFIANSPSINGGTQLGETVDLTGIYGEDYNCLGDGKWHNLKMRVFDDTITVYWDGQEVITYTDTGVSENKECLRVFAVGGVGIGTYQTSVYVDNLLVERLTDTFGGDYDNQIGGNWNLPIPDYVLEYEEKY